VNPNVAGGFQIVCGKGSVNMRIFELYALAPEQRKTAESGEVKLDRTKRKVVFVHRIGSVYSRWMFCVDKRGSIVRGSLLVKDFNLEVKDSTRFLPA